MVYYVKHNTKYIVLLVLSVAAFSAFFTCALSFLLKRENTVYIPINKSYYFLYADGDMGVEASASSASLSGGAGYIYSYGGREYVILAVYEDELSALTVSGRIKETGILALSAEGFKTDKSIANKLKKYLGVLISVAAELYRCANDYDGGKINHARLVLLLSTAEGALSAAFSEEAVKGYSPFADLQVEDTLSVLQSAATSSYPSSDIRYAQAAICAAVLSYA